MALSGRDDRLFVCSAGPNVAETISESLLATPRALKVMIGMTVEMAILFGTRRLTNFYLLRLLIIILLSSLCATRGAHAEDTVSSPSLHAESTIGKPSVAQSVISGPLEIERTALLEKILEAKNEGVGIQNYMTAFLDIESMVKQGASQESIRQRLDSIERGLSQQLPLTRQLQHPADAINESDASIQVRRKALPLESARTYVLALVNADRAKYHLPPLTLDVTASASAQAHSDEMASLGYSAHWDKLGRKPDQRYTEFGGMHSVSENLANRRSFSTSDKAPGNSVLERAPFFLPEELQEMQSYFMSEKPPDDLHRKQILAAEHNKLGVGLSRSVNGKSEFYLCLDQEFVDDYGEYSKLPKKIDPAAPFELSGSLVQGMNLCSLSIRWEPAPSPLTKEELNTKPHCYSIPKTLIANYVVPANPSAPLKVWVKDKREHFSVHITPDESWKTGLYYVLIWAKRHSDKEPILISARTILLD